MTDTTNAPSGDLSALKVAQLQQIAAELGIKGARRMRKGELIEALRSGQSGQSGQSGRQEPLDLSAKPDDGGSPGGTGGRPGAATDAVAPGDSKEPAVQRAGSGGQDSGPQPDHQDDEAQVGGKPDQTGRQQTQNNWQDKQDAQSRGQQGRQDRSGQQDGSGQQDRQDEGGQQGRADNRDQQGRRGQGGQQNQRGQGAKPDQGGKHQGGKPGQGSKQDQGGKQGQRGKQAQGEKQDAQQGGRKPSVDDIQLPEPREETDDPRRSSRSPGGQDGPGSADDGSDRGNRRRRGRDRGRDRKRRGGRNDDLPYDEVELSPDDVLIPIAGILDILDNYAFVRTSGYLPGANDVYVSLNQVRRYGLRRGDAIVGAVRQPREGEQTNQRQKFNALVRLDTVNGSPAEQATDRPTFADLTPLYPRERLRLETRAGELGTRVVDLVTPVGKGQRGLIVAPPKAGKTMLMQQIANAVTANNPEVHLMVVLVDERPEEVTEMQRTVKGEVVASTFDRPASDHTVVAELAIERAKRLVELGQDVVVLLDSLTRLARGYNLAAPGSGRVLSGGMDAAALYPAKRFFGAARNIEHGGSLTILAAAAVETGSRLDEVIYEEFKDTGNSELRLSRELADRRTFPAVDVTASSTRREDMLVAEGELQAIWKLRRMLASSDEHEAIATLLNRMRGSSSNAAFLQSVNSGPANGKGRSGKDS